MNLNELRPWVQHKLNVVPLQKNLYAMPKTQDVTLPGVNLLSVLSKTFDEIGALDGSAGHWCLRNWYFKDGVGTLQKGKTYKISFDYIIQVTGAQTNPVIGIPTIEFSQWFPNFKVYKTIPNVIAGNTYTGKVAFLVQVANTITPTNGYLNTSGKYCTILTTFNNLKVAVYAY